MAEEEEIIDQGVAAEEEEAEPTDLMSALQEVLKKARYHDGLAIGLRECAKTLDKRTAHLCVLAEDCTEAAYTRLVEALCKEHKIDLIKVAEKKKLGEWVGIARYDKTGNAKKIRKCGCVVIKDYGEKSKAMDMLLDHFRKE
eukprot:TRINITY_DN100340_c0_g1_i1.p1 TRINITY_DN100340_c0_g1~~TRINITY_DN100340_c0_g1_i1.p1  ORF type:complete len:150 (-),score=45.31 TRINITY_DN100340_c0_g1_i1:58-483(-)